MKKVNLVQVGIALGLILTVASLIKPELSYARDLVAASNTATNTVKTIGRSISALGVVVGGIMMQIPGATEFGRKTLGGGLLGCLCTFGGPAIINLISTIFGEP